MPKVTPCTYIPILYTKRGERSALSDLNSSIDESYLPLFIINPIEWDFDNDEPKKDITNHLQPIVKDLLKKWRGTACFVDAEEVGDTPMADGRHPLTWIVETLRAQGRDAIPVTGLNRSIDYQSAVQNLVAQNLELCIRLPIGDWNQATIHPSSLLSLITLVGSTPEATHLVLDAGLHNRSTTGSFTQMTLNNLYNPSTWASIIVTTSSMPASMPSGDGLHTIPRPEWPEYKNLLSLPLRRKPSFGDYVIQSPDSSSNLNPRVISPSNNLRFLMDDFWYLPKSGQFKKGGSKPLVSMLTLLSKQVGYIAGNSACETWIDEIISNPTGNAGNPEAWRRYGTVRHITRTVELIASLCASSESPSPGPAALGAVSPQPGAGPSHFVS